MASYEYPKFDFSAAQRVADAEALRHVAVGDMLLVVSADSSPRPDIYMVRVMRVLATQFLTMPVGEKHGEQRWSRKSGRPVNYGGYFPPGIHALTSEAQAFWDLWQAEDARRKTVERIRSFAWELSPVQAMVLRRLQMTLLLGDASLNELATLLMLQDALEGGIARARGAQAEAAREGVRASV